MKRILYLLPLLILVNGSCYYDYEEGADLSFYTAKGRLCQKWVLNSIWIDGIDSSGMSPYNKLMDKWTIYIGRPDVGVGYGVVYSPNPATPDSTTRIEWDTGKLPATWELKSIYPIFNRYKVPGVNIFFENISYKIICLRRNRLVIEASPNPNSLYKRKTRLLFKTP